ncbi:LysR family transcriptional regulator [Bacillus ndiopicus]|uniref:LysR family transcriptional regulator n=1 Tax=Bacillus ndiopicus TaxID=1347368 RepID=UPI0005A67FFE|nr:LysR family transcriptional regulator [Bacillus ndiopicus]
MEFKDLKSFITVVENGSFTKAANESFVSQPSLSKSIKRLEDSLNVELLDRSTRHVILTDVGVLVYEQSHKILRAVEELNIALDDLMNMKSGVIKVGIPPLIGTLFFPRIARDFHSRYPDVQLQLIERGAKAIAPLVDSGQIDVGFVVLPTDEKHFTVTPFIEDTFYAFLHEAHPLANQESISLADLKQEKFILFTEEFALHDYIIKKCRTAGFQPNVSYKSSQWDLIIELVASNLGVTLLPKSIYEKQMNSNVKIVPIEGVHLPWSLAIITKKNAYQSYAQKEFLKLIGEGRESDL